jgi:hypothetical protein
VAVVLPLRGESAHAGFEIDSVNIGGKMERATGLEPRKPVAEDDNNQSDSTCQDVNFQVFPQNFFIPAGQIKAEYDRLISAALAAGRSSAR